MQDRVTRWFWKVVKVLFLVEMALIFTAELLRHISTFEFYVGVVITSIGAYLVYTYRHPHVRQKRGSSGAERTPVMARSET